MRFFPRFARLMLRDRAALIAAIGFAMVSAGGLGVGLVAVGKLLRVLLKEGSSLRAEAMNFNVERLWGMLPVSWLEALPEDRLAGVEVILAGLVALTIVGATANFLHEFLAATVSARAAARVRTEAFRTAVHLPLRTIVRRGPAEFVARIVRDAAELQRGFLVLTSRSVAQVSNGVAAFLAAVFIDWRLTLVALVVAPIMAVLLRKLGKRIRRGTRGALEAQEELLRTTNETLQGLRSIKSATAERAAFGRFRRANRAALRGELRVRTARALAGPLIETLAIVVVCGLVLFAAREIIAGRLEFDRFVLALAALGVAGASFKPMTALVSELQAAEAPAQRLAEIIDEPQEPRAAHRLAARRDRRRAAGALNDSRAASAGPEALGMGRRPALARPAHSIRFEVVRLRYPGAIEDALRGVTLEIPHGAWIALVGPNGCGKTTLASLLPRLLDPDDGRIVIDGVDIATVDLRSLRRQVGVVTQETVLLRGTIAENIAFGVAGANDATIRAAAERAHAATFIDRLPGGYSAPVADQGATLSGGQRQRIAIARAILRDPAILILDEATSQIDPESERQINDAIGEFRHGRTVIAIAHRPSTMRAADRIVVMDTGLIVDEGTHDELLARCDMYRRIVGDVAQATAP
ncbi:MAG: ABC transporter ATP-binding protein [Phycisphaerales bacterium]